MSKMMDQLRAEQEPINERCKKVIDEKLHICSRSDGELCKVYAFPNAKWRVTDCPMADQELRTLTPEQEAAKVRVGQQKQKKKSRK